MYTLSCAPLDCGFECLKPTVYSAYANTHSQALITRNIDPDGHRLKHKPARNYPYTHTVRKSTADVCWTDWLGSERLGYAYYRHPLVAVV